VGQAGYSIWGSEVYTYDSHLATAAIHAGVLKAGQRGIVKVTMVKSPDAHRGKSDQNGGEERPKQAGHDSLLSNFK